MDNKTFNERQRIKQLEEKVTRNLSGIQKVLEYVPKTDRDLDILKKKQKAICSTSTGVFVYSIHEGLITNTSKLDPSEAVPTYQTMRMMRHDAWINFINVVKTDVIRIEQGDVRVADLMEDIKEQYKLVGRTFKIPTIPSTHQYRLAGGEYKTVGVEKMTPDIMFYNASANIVIIGDVAVTNNIKRTTQEKITKYSGLVHFIKNICGIDVDIVNFILDTDLTNASKIYETFIAKGYLMRDYEKFEVFSTISQLAHTTMELIKNKTTSKQDFYVLLDKVDKVQEKMLQDVTLPNKELYEEIEEEKPIRQEEDILLEVKIETERLLEEGMFNVNNNEVKESFKFIEKKMKDRIRDNNDLSMNPKETLKFSTNDYSLEEKTDYTLALDYIEDILTVAESSEEAKFILNLLPTYKQTTTMEAIYKARKNPQIRDMIIGSAAKDKVYGAHQYLSAKDKYKNNYHTIKLLEHLKYSTKTPNEQKEQGIIDPETFEDHRRDVEKMINYYGDVSQKPSFLDETWDAKTETELKGSDYAKKCYKYVKSTNGCQLANTLSNFFHRTAHISNKQSNKDNLFVANNGSFIGIIFKEHSSIKSQNCQLPFITITRVSKKEKYSLDIEHNLTFETIDNVYYISKLCRMPISKVNNFDAAGYRLAATASYVMSLNERFFESRKRIVGIMTLFMLDQHQKTSKLLDLMKYIAFMPFAEISMLPELVKDKFDILYKTKLDIWLFKHLQDFVEELSKTDKLNPKKKKLHSTFDRIHPESLGIKVSLPSFYNLNIRHDVPQTYIEEVNSANIIRSKMLYGGQFMDKSMSDTLKWNNDYEKEIKKHGDWVVNGRGEGNFPNDSMFAFDRDMMIYAQNRFNKNLDINKEKLATQVAYSDITQFMHYRCSLRGCTKAFGDRGYKVIDQTHYRMKKSTDIDNDVNYEQEEYKTKQTKIDLHSTSLEECIKYYKSMNFSQELASVLMVSNYLLINKLFMEVAMSPKEQRGDGRPIATGTLFTKAAYYMIERPEAILGKSIPSNVVVEETNKLKEMCETYKSCILEANQTGRKFKQAYQANEDQQKFSENDNTRKYIPYINNNYLLPLNVRRIQKTMIIKNVERRHIMHKVPKMVLNDPDLIKWKIPEEELPTFKVIIGWPQGMLNNISTNVHAIADYYITYSYNICYPNNKVYTKGLVHSDDSWITVCCNSLEDFRRFMIYRTLMKRRFCLKLNIKKLWGSSLMGELVSNYNMNGSVHYSVVKQLANSFGSLNYKCWTIDVTTQISALQQAFRNGADMSTVILLSTILRQQLLNSYHVSETRKKMLSVLPVELGGYPGNSPFELAMTGLVCHNEAVSRFIKNNPTHAITQNILKLLDISIIYNKSANYVDYRLKLVEFLNNNKKTNLDNELSPNDFDINIDKKDLLVPTKSDIFSCIKYIMPRTTKVSRTVNTIEKLEFESDDLELLITRPDTLAESLGNLKKLTHNMLYELAAANYSSNIRLIAIAQSIQSAGKTVKIHGLKNMTYDELFEYLSTMRSSRSSIENIELCLTDDTNVASLCSACVHSSEIIPITNDKRKVINRLPLYNDKFTTVCKLKDVLLYLVDKRIKGASYYTKYSSMKSNEELLSNDMDLIIERFKIYFDYYETKKAVNMIMKNYGNALKVRLWTQPKLRNDTLENFICDLYGKTLSPNANYNVSIDLIDRPGNKSHQDIVESIYSVAVVDTLYPGYFVMESFGGKTMYETLRAVDYSLLNEQGRIKYGILMLHFFGIQDYIKKYDKSREFFCEYIQSQRFEKGKYVGNMEILVKYGSTLLKIKGTEGNIEIESSTSDLGEILKGMYLFTNKCFKPLSYDHHMQWGQSKLWTSQKTAKYSSQWLTYLSPSNTIVSTTKLACSIPFKLNKNLRGVDSFTNITSDRYFLDLNLRRVYKMVNDHKVPVTSTNQNLRCPYKDAIKLIEKDFDGNLNTDLVRTNAIFRMTLEGHKGIQGDIAKYLLEKNNRITNSLIANVIAALFNSVKKDTYKDSYFRDRVQDYEDYKFEITGVADEQLLDLFEDTDPTDITSIEIEYTPEERIEGTALCNIKNSTYVLTKACSKYLTEPEMDDFRIYLSTHTDIIETVNENIGAAEDYISSLEIALEEVEKDLPLLSAIYLNRLDTDSEWPVRLFEYLEKMKGRVIMNSQGRTIASKIIDIIVGTKHDLESAVDVYKRLAV